MSTVFSKIIKGEISAFKIYEDEYVVAFLDSNPIQKGHTLVVPKQEIVDIFMLEDEMYDHVMHRVRYMAQILRVKMECKKVCAFIEGYGVPHAHVHLVPTNKPEDFDKSLAHLATHDELEAVQKKILRVD